MIEIAGYEWGWDNARALIGIVAIYGVCWLICENRSKFPWRIIIGATAIQFLFALILFGIPLVKEGLLKANLVVDGLQNATRAGTGFVFGYIGDNTTYAENMTIIPGDTPPPLFFFQILPIVIVVAALSAVLWHWRILQWITNGFAFVFRRGMGLGGAISLAVSANVFMGMTEAPVLIRPYMKGMTRSELLIMMTAGFATIAGSVLIVYGAFLQPTMGDAAIPQLLAASIIASPAAVSVALAMIPEVTSSADRMTQPDFGYSSTMDAFSRGATDGLQIVFNITTMLIAALATLWLINAGLGLFWEVGGEPLSIERVLGWIFAPVMYLVGVPWEDAARSGSLVGIKTVLTEFVAFLQLAEIPNSDMDPRTRMITAHAICGFANFGSMGILIGGLSIIEPARRDDFLALAWRTLLGGTLATCLSAAVVGFLPFQLFEIVTAG